MHPMIAQAEAALQAGQHDEAFRLLTEALEAPDLQAPARIFQNVCAVLFRRGQPALGERWAQRGIEQHPQDAELHNMRGVFLRRLGRPEEALSCLQTSLRLNPRSLPTLQNLGNICNDLRDGPGAVDAFTKLVRQQPANADLQRGLGRGFLNSGDFDKAVMRFSLAAKLKPESVDIWLDYASALLEAHRTDECLAMLEQAITGNPGEGRLMSAKAVALRRAGRRRDADRFLSDIVAQDDSQAWAHHQLGATCVEYDRERGNRHLQRALELAPDNLDIRMALAESLNRSRYGDEAAHIEAAYQVLRPALQRPITSLVHLKVCTEVLIRVCAFEERDRLAPFEEVGRRWASGGMHAALLAQLARSETPADRRELIHQHKLWGEQAQAAAARAPIRRPPRRAPDGKIRVGFMSSDLRAHPVAYFALPLFEFYDRQRFELYCYSFYQGQEDGIQKAITGAVKAFRWHPDISDRDAAQMIADDQLDILIELGGSTHMNKLNVMAFHPAEKLASWVGYPHSAGPTAIDHIVLDPHLVPDDPALLIETPLVMPHSWLALGRTFSERHEINTESLASDRNGFITFGTANNPHKYSERLIRTWARVVAAVPGSKFAFIRPEGDTPSFRANIERYFAAEGVSADRIVFHTVRGAHMPFYNEVDVTLDPFPLTGGTSTCEALWMGAPVVNLRGEALFERLSYSILSNVGLGHHSVEDIDGYIDLAVRLAADREQRMELRRTLRDRIKASPLGQQETFARDFYEMIAGAVQGAKAQPATAS
ncbi:MAG: tetratricopeptide repeat protein [Phenylobacterium sp.]